MPKTAIKPGPRFAANEAFALAFGLFLGLAILKFGNPVILDNKVDPPVTFSDYWSFAWPPHWAGFFLLPLFIAGGLLAWFQRARWAGRWWLWVLPLIWLGWQFFSALTTVDAALTSATLWQFSGCVACYFLGGLLFRNERVLCWLLVGLLAAFTFCLVRAIDQKLFEFPVERQILIEGQNDGWTNLPPAVLVEMKREQIIINTNDADIANPVILQKFTKGRVSGTMVYPNALAEIILLLFPISLALVFTSTLNLKQPVRLAAIALVIFLGAMAFFWTGSKLGWLIAMALGALYLFRLDWPPRWKRTALLVLVMTGLAVFSVRFHSYFAAGATSVGARFDYWRAALQTTGSHPLFGTGPGTFQRPYAMLKAPQAEMARLAHNDFLEQFSDSGLVGGVSYLTWIVFAIGFAGKTVWSCRSALLFSCFIGIAGWYAQSLGEFGLYIPASAWTAFTLLGSTIAIIMNRFDKSPAAR